ncbi:iron complex outermembrane recepter protein [Tangfeifania diversioriginum]|uniref:Iron complex outermembrane recepter protein n=1 Tax=Tangfeifania diversioriginum TaxID=1168035 RepID=A0A1M6LAC9_9BACT|nr:TonB-dependent receptor plug domain-containing protein [Tangfeifania diversioriginum]SHJ68160.1 iron complex outermembrane recepter protein [Tangfeifania diversioriginum]
MNPLKSFLLVLFLLSFHLMQAQNLSDTVHIEEVQVLAKKKIEEAGLKITRPDSLAMASSVTADLSELISGFSPVFIKSYGQGSSATASFRGTAATHTQILWNGMNLNSPMRGLADLSLLPVFFTDNLYLLHGGSSLSEGSGGLGGSIHLENNPDWSTRFSVSGLAELASFQTRKTFFKLMAGTENFKSNTRLFYEASENDFSFFNSGVIPHRKDTLENADFRKTGVLQEFYLRSNENEIFSLRFWYQESHRNLPQLMSYEGSTRDEFQNDQQLRAQLEWKKYSDGWNTRIFSGVSSNRLEYFRATPQFNFVNENSESRETSFLNHFRFFKRMNEVVFATLSFDANLHRVKTSNLLDESGYLKNRFETSLLMKANFKSSDSFAAFLLLRSESFDKSIVPFIPAAGLEWQPFARFPVVLLSNIARNYHKPTLNDLYWIPGGNPDLQPEDGFTGDVSLSGDFQLGKMTFKNEVTGFASKIENWISWQPASSGAWYWEAQNVKNVFSRGIEYSFSAEYDWKSFRFRTSGNYSFTRTSNLDAVSSVDQSRGKQLIYIPKHKGNFHFNTSWKKFAINYSLNYVGKRFTKSSNQESEFERVLNPYWLNKIAIGRKSDFGNYAVNLKFTVENLLDENYQSILWRPMPGRFYRFSVAINYKN